MNFTKSNRKACLNVIRLLMKIIDNDLPYSQTKYLQFEDSSGRSQLIRDWNKLIKHNRTCCIMGYLLADAKFQKAGGGDDGVAMIFGGCSNTDAFEQYVGFNCSVILLASNPMSITQALTWFIEKFNSQLTISGYGME